MTQKRQIKGVQLSGLTWRPRKPLKNAHSVISAAICVICGKVPDFRTLPCPDELRFREKEAGFAVRILIRIGCVNRVSLL